MEQLSSQGRDSAYPVVVKEKGEVVIENGTFKGDTTLVYLFDGTAIIKGGYFEAKPWYDNYKKILTDIH